ncbi:MAG: DNA repair protein RecO (recombination protein O) [Bacteroidia bacterium]|jgi:DNA repair protein RecO (recombination protein O)
MLSKTRGIVVRNTNFKDNSVISHIYTHNFGMQSFMLHGVRNQKGNIRPSHIMSLSLVDLVFYKKENAGIQQVKELRCSPVLQSIHFNILKNSVALFMAEIISATVTEEEQNADLFQFLEQFILMLDLESEKIGNYSIYFLVHLTRYLGFYPKGQYNENQVFNLNEGMFIDQAYEHLNCLSPEMSKSLWQMLHTPTSDLTDIHLPRTVRGNLLDQLLFYYEIHGLHGRKIKSHKVLREVLK